MNGNFIGDQSISFQSMQAKMTAHGEHRAKRIRLLLTIQAFSGGGGGTSTNTGPSLHHPETAGAARRNGGPNHRAPAAQSCARIPGVNSVPAVLAGSADRRPPECGAISIHVAERQPAGTDALGAGTYEPDEEDAGAYGCEQRSAGQRAGGQSGD